VQWLVLGLGVLVGAGLVHWWLRPPRAPPGRLTRARAPGHTPIRLLWLSAFTFFLSFLLLLSALPIFARRLGASDAAVGVIMATFAVSSLLLRPPTGWAADRFGRRPFMLAGALVFVVATLAYGWTGGRAGPGPGAAAARLRHGTLSHGGQRHGRRHHAARSTG
jgi:MFS family permease